MTKKKDITMSQPSNQAYEITNLTKQCHLLCRTKKNVYVSSVKIKSLRDYALLLNLVMSYATPYIFFSLHNAFLVKFSLNSNKKY